jgi:mRNA interferase RelE/StbE
MYSVKYHKQVIKFLQKHDAGTRCKIVDFFDAIKKNDPKDFRGYDIKQLRGFDDKFRLRIGKFRVIFSIADDLLLIEAIKAGSRGDVYK